MLDVWGDANGVLWIRNDGKPFAKVTDENGLKDSRLNSWCNDVLFDKDKLDTEYSQSYDNGWYEGKEEGEAEGFERAKSDIIDIIGDEEEKYRDCKKITEFVDIIMKKIEYLD